MDVFLFCSTIMVILKQNELFMKPKKNKKKKQIFYFFSFFFFFLEKQMKDLFWEKKNDDKINRIKMNLFQLLQTIFYVLEKEKDDKEFQNSFCWSWCISTKERNTLTVLDIFNF